MLKKAKAGVLVLMVILVSGLNAGNYTVPNGFKLIKTSYGAKMYKDSSIDMYAVVVDMDKSTIEFDTFDHSYGDKYERHTMQKWWNDYADYSTFAMVNGQFFNHKINPSKIAYPVKADGNIITSHVDNNDAKRSLLVSNSGEVYIRNGYNSFFMNSYNIKDMIVGLSPSVEKKKWWPIGRNYIGGIPRGNCNPNVSSCTYRYIIFFIGKGQSQPNFLSRIMYWGVKEKSIVMMDGSASSQLISDNIKVYGYRIPGLSSGQKRPVPHVIKINKW